MSYVPQSGKLITAKYLVDAQCQRGEAHIDLQLIRHDDEWQILQFYVTSPSLLK